MKWNCIGYVIGLCSLHWLEDKHHIINLLIITSVALLSFLVFRSRRLVTFRKIQSLTLPWLLGLGFSCVTALFWVERSMPLFATSGEYKVSGYICSIPKHDKVSNYNSISTRLSFDFCATSIKTMELGFYQGNRLRIKHYRASEKDTKVFKAGSAWQLVLKLKPIYGRKNPNSFDYEKWSVSEGVLASGYIRKSKQLSEHVNWRQHYHSLRQTLFDKLITLIPQSDGRGVILALSIGERGEITPRQWDNIKGSGTAHLLAISGLHIGIAALWAYTIALLSLSRVTLLTRVVPAQRLAEVFSLTAALSIALISGFGYPAQRALVMLLIFFICRWSARQYSLGNLLAVSVVFITLIQPFAVLSVSFWLSVLAVSIIAVIQSYQQELNGGFVQIKNWLRLNWFLFLGLFLELYQS